MSGARLRQRPILADRLLRLVLLWRFGRVAHVDGRGSSWHVGDRRGHVEDVMTGPLLVQKLLQVGA